MTDFDRLDPDMWAVYQLAEAYSKQRNQNVFWRALEIGVDQGFRAEKELRKSLGKAEIEALANSYTVSLDRYPDPNPNLSEWSVVDRMYTKLRAINAFTHYGRLAALVTYLDPALKRLEEKKELVECTTMLLGCLTKSPRQKKKIFLRGFAMTLPPQETQSAQPKSFCLLSSLHTQDCTTIPSSCSGKVTKQEQDLLKEFPGWSGPVEYVGMRRTDVTSEVFLDKKGKVKVRVITLLTTMYDFGGKQVDTSGKSEILLCDPEKRRTLPNYNYDGGGALGFALRDLGQGLTPLVQWERVEDPTTADYSPPVTYKELKPYREELRQALGALLQKKPLCTVGQVGQIARLDKALAAMYPWSARILPDTSRCGKCHKTKGTNDWFVADPIPQDGRSEWTSALQESPDRWRWPATWLPPVARDGHKVFEEWCKQRGEFVWRLLSQEARNKGRPPPPRCL